MGLLDRKKELARLLTVIVLVIAVTPLPLHQQASAASTHFTEPPITISYWNATIEGSITSVKTDVQGLYIAFATDTGMLGIYDSSGNRIWASSLRDSILGLAIDPSMETLAAVSSAKELAVYGRSGGLIDYWDRCSRYEPVDLLYDYQDGLLVVTDERGYIYVYNVSDPTGRGEALAGYAYTSDSFNVSASWMPGRSHAVLLMENGEPRPEVAVYVSAHVDDNRTGTPENYMEPLILVYNISTGQPVLETAVLLEDLKGGYVDAMYYYAYSGARYLVIASTGKERLVSVYPVEPLLGSLSPPGEASASWSYVLGDTAVYLALSPDAYRLVVASKDYNLYLFESVVPGNYGVSPVWAASLGNEVTALAYSHERGIVAGGTIDGWVYAYNTGGDRLWHAFLGSGTVTALDAAESLPLLVVGTEGGVIHVFAKADAEMRLLEVALLGDTGPISGANITVRSQDGQVELSGKTTAVFLLPIGTYTVTIDHRDIGVYTETIDLETDMIMQVESSKLVQPTYMLTIRAIDSETGSPVSGANITLENQATGAVYTVETGATGTAILLIPRGPYAYRIEHSLYKPVEGSLGWLMESRTLGVALEPLRAQLAIRVYSPVDGPLKKAHLFISGPETLETETDEQGAALLSLRLGSYTITAYAPHHVPESTTVDLGSEGASVVMTLDPQNYTVKISALDSETGESLGYVILHITGTLGIDEITVLTPGNNTLTLPYGSYTLEIGNPKYHEEKLSFTLVADTVIPVYLDPIRTDLAVKVFSPVDGPLPGVTVTLTGEEAVSALTDDSGIARLRPRLGNYTLSVTAPHHKHYTASITVTGAQEVTVWLQPEEYRLRIEVRDSELNTSVNAWVYVEHLELGVKMNETVAGVFDKQLPYGDYEVVIGAPGYHMASYEMKLSEDYSETVKLVPVRYMVRIIVVGETVGPVKGAQVSLVLPGVESISGTTSESGSITAKLREASYRISVSEPHHQSYVGEILVTRPGDIVVELKPLNYTLSIIALDSRDKSLIPVYMAEITGPLPRGPTTFTLTPGNNTLTLPYGSYDVRIYQEHYKEYDTSISLESSSNITAILEPKSYALVVSVASRLGYALPGAEIEAYWKNKLVATTYTGDQGSATLVLPYGEYSLQVSARHHISLETTVLLDAQKTIGIELDPIYYTINVTVLDAEFKTPISRGRIDVYREGALFSEYNFTNGSAIIGLPYGSYTFKVVSTDFVEEDRDVDISGPLSLEFRLKPIEYPVTITVLDDRGKPLSGAEVVFMGPRSFTAYTSADGTIETKLRKGYYRVSARYNGFKEGEKDIYVAGAVQETVKLKPYFSTLLKRYLPMIVAIMVIPASLAGLAYLLRKRREKELEEGMEDFLLEEGLE